MSVQVENLEKNTAKLTIEVPAEKFEELYSTPIIRIRVNSISRASEKAKLPLK